MANFLGAQTFPHRWFGRRSRASSPRSATSARPRVRLRLEWLEDRLTPSTAANATELATVIQQDNASNTADTIVLTGGVNDYQLAGQLEITDAAGLTIQGQGQTLDAAHHRAFLIQAAGANIVFQKLTIRNGIATEDGTGVSNTDAKGGGILDKGGNVTLSHVVLESNAADANGGHNAYGGGVYASGGSLTIRSSVIQFNGAFGGLGSSTANGGSAYGGGVFTSGTTTTLTGSQLSGNVLLGGSAGTGHDGGYAFGGGVYVSGGTTSITSSDLSGNQLTGGDGRLGGGALGGGLFIDGPVTIALCQLTNNQLTGGKGNLDTALTLGGDIGGAARGGGAYVAGTTTTITSSLLSDNTLKGGDGSLNNSSANISGDIGGDAEGGAVYLGSRISNVSTTTVSTSILSGNSVTGGNGSYSSGTVNGNIGGDALGGGVYASSQILKATLTASTLSDNTVSGGDASGGSATRGAAAGGGGYFAGDSQIVNSTIADNQASGGNGGGLYFAKPATATLFNDTVAENSAPLKFPFQGDGHGGGIDNQGVYVILVNTLVALNSAGTDTPDFNGGVLNSDHNLIGNADGSNGFDAAHGDQLGTLANPLDPHLGPLQNNGGASAGVPGSQQVVPTLALLSGSPAINAGDNNAESTTGPFDQRGPGFARVVNGTIDIGAFEVQPTSPSPSPSPAPPPTLHTPPLLAFFDGLFHGVETVNDNDTETVVDSIFGITLFVSSYDGAGNLTSVTLFGINVTIIFELL